ncbi:MAG TPA: hypothetical protein VLH81_07620 [Desulfobacterales bacterium]|nr:hypothetical protein [Desulfobacterales bacterium]
MTRRCPRNLVAAACVAAAWLAACASTSVLGIDYRSPAPPTQTLGRTVSLVVEDQRPSAAFLSPMARDELEGFANAFALTLSKPGGLSELRGAYELAPLFREVLRARLEAAGVRVAAAGARPDAQLTFALKDFALDFGDRKWSSRLGFEAMLVRDGSTLSRQTVSGSAERVKIVGKGEAEKLLSELITDTVNQMDVNALFKQAGL